MCDGSNSAPFVASARPPAQIGNSVAAPNPKTMSSETRGSTSGTHTYDGGARARLLNVEASTDRSATSRLGRAIPMAGSLWWTKKRERQLSHSDLPFTKNQERLPLKIATIPPAESDATSLCAV